LLLSGSLKPRTRMSGSFASLTAVRPLCIDFILSSWGRCWQLLFALRGSETPGSGKQYAIKSRAHFLYFFFNREGQITNLRALIIFCSRALFNNSAWTFVYTFWGEGERVGKVSKAVEWPAGNPLLHIWRAQINKGAEPGFYKYVYMNILMHTSSSVM